MELPINEQDLIYIMEMVKNRMPSLYNKLWAYKLKTAKEKTDGLS
jgi:hypothetical protein